MWWPTRSHPNRDCSPLTTRRFLDVDRRRARASPHQSVQTRHPHVTSAPHPHPRPSHSWPARSHSGLTIVPRDHGHPERPHEQQRPHEGIVPIAPTGGHPTRRNDPHTHDEPEREVLGVSHSAGRSPPDTRPPGAGTDAPPHSGTPRWGTPDSQCRNTGGIPYETTRGRTSPSGGIV